MATQRNTTQNKTKPKAPTAPATVPSFCEWVVSEINRIPEWVTILAYVAGGFLTFGKVFAVNYANLHDVAVGVPSLFAGVFWPIYWICHFSVRLFS